MKRSSSDPKLNFSVFDPTPLPELQVRMACYDCKAEHADRDKEVDTVRLQFHEKAPLSVVWESGVVLCEYVQAI